MFEIKEVTYEEARSEYLEEQMQKAQRRMKYWESRIDRSRPGNLMDVAYAKASDAGWEYNFYKDALEALAAQPKWISVEDELPPVGERVLACIAKHHICEAFIDCEDMWHKSQNCYELKGTVTHWMPLPESPKEEA